jgi:hypothetical protein
MSLHETFGEKCHMPRRVGAVNMWCRGFGGNAISYNARYANHIYCIHSDNPINKTYQTFFEVGWW